MPDSAASPASTPWSTSGRVIGARAGIGLRAPHYRRVLEEKPALGWFEVHSENFFGAGGQPHWFLERIRALYSCSLHGVGLSLGSAAALDLEHLRKLKTLAARVEPTLMSDHLCWGRIDGRHLNDLLPLPYTEEALDHVCTRVAQAQEALGRRLLIENVSAYLQYKHSTIPEWEFVAALAQRTGCGLLLDINNIYVNAINHGFDPLVYLRAIPAHAVEEMHLAGFDRADHCLIDTHGKPVHDAVWTLYRIAVQLIGPKPTLIEWDTDIPELEVLLGEAGKAQAILDRSHAEARRHAA
jgi:uncharacterized protein (UPF0276 family)